jgi:hypothetical protein
MALSLASFRAAYPVFDQVPDATVSAQLTIAEAQISRSVWDAYGDESKADAGVGFLTAAALCRQMGEHAPMAALELEAAYNRIAGYVGGIVSEL